LVDSVMVMMRTRRPVVVTGAAGRIGRAIAPLLPQDWEMQETDLNARDGISVLDVSDPDACRLTFTGADAVVHLAAVPDPTASWSQLLPANIVGVYQVARAAADCGVRRLVLASSLQSVCAMPDQTQSRAGDPPRPGNLYRATKAWAESVGAWIAATTSTSVVALRIGYFAEQRPDAAAVCAPRTVSLAQPARRRRAGALRRRRGGLGVRRRQRNLRQPLPDRRSEGDNAATGLPPCR